MTTKINGNSVRISSAPTSGKDEPDAKSELCYAERRFDQYPMVFDQLDAVWKQLEHDRTGGRILQADTNDMLDQILTIKARHPKSD